jgi:hypothetical protein
MRLASAVGYSDSAQAWSVRAVSAVAQYDEHFAGCGRETEKLMGGQNYGISMQNIGA